MQIITGYNKSYAIRKLQQFRLYHLSRPAIKKYRSTRHNHPFIPDCVDKYIIDNYSGNRITAIDCAGWYLKYFNIDVTCLESDAIAQLYYPECHIEFDILIHRPTYISHDDPVLLKNPWFLKYAQFDVFIHFLNIWTMSTVVLNFEPRYIKHNHLKFNLIDLAKEHTDLKIVEQSKNLWIIQRF